MELLDAATIAVALDDLEGWRYDGDHLVRDLEFDDFLAAIAFIGRVAPLAEANDHHPELRNVHRNVEVRLRTHDVGGITERDVALAHQIDGVVRVTG
jgi:4a-hydroxytetrahydrobiopterin dehydratase